MDDRSQCQVTGEIRRILRASATRPEVLLRVRGRARGSPGREGYLHVRAVDVRNRVRAVGIGREVRVVLLATAGFVEELERPHRSLVPGRPRAEKGLLAPIRIVGYDTLVAGRVVRVLDADTFLLDAGIPILVRVPQPTGLPEEGDHVEFLLHEPLIAEIF